MRSGILFLIGVFGLTASSVAFARGGETGDLYSVGKIGHRGGTVISRSGGRGRAPVSISSRRAIRAESGKTYSGGGARRGRLR